MFPRGVQSAIARKVGLSRGFVSNVIKGRKRTSLKFAKKLVAACLEFGVVTDLVFWSGAK
jgi:DNA-binding XRE family transcriptional regulator